MRRHQRRAKPQQANPSQLRPPRPPRLPMDTASTTAIIPLYQHPLRPAPVRQPPPSRWTAIPRSSDLKANPITRASRGSADCDADATPCANSSNRPIAAYDDVGSCRHLAPQNRAPTPCVAPMPVVARSCHVSALGETIQTSRGAQVASLMCLAGHPTLPHIRSCLRRRFDRRLRNESGPASCRIGQSAACEPSSTALASQSIDFIPASTTLRSTAPLGSYAARRLYCFEARASPAS